MCDTETHIFVDAVRDCCCKDWEFTCKWEFAARAWGDVQAQTVVVVEFLGDKVYTPPKAAPNPPGQPSFSLYFSGSDSKTGTVPTRVFTLQPRTVAWQVDASVVEKMSVYCHAKCLEEEASSARTCKQGASDHGIEQKVVRSLSSCHVRASICRLLLRWPKTTSCCTPATPAMHQQSKDDSQREATSGPCKWMVQRLRCSRVGSEQVRQRPSNARLSGRRPLLVQPPWGRPDMHDSCPHT